MPVLEAVELEETEEEETEEKTYTINDLPDSVKSAVIDKYRQFDVEYDGWWDPTYEDWKETLEKQGFLQPKIWFSGFCSQGDGACFDIGSFDIKAFSQHHKPYFVGEFFPNINRYLNAIQDNISFTIRELDHHYSHYNTRDFEWDYSTGSDSVEEELGSKLAATFEDKVIELTAYIEETRESLCKQIYKALSDEYDYLTSDEYIEERLRDYDYRFNEDGEKVD